MKYRINIAIFWGIMDLLSILWYVIWNISQKQVPLFYDLERIAQNARMFGLPELKYVFYFTAIIYLSPDYIRSSIAF